MPGACWHSPVAPAGWPCTGAAPRWLSGMSEHSNLPPAGHEAADITLRPILIGSAGVLVVLALLGGLTGWLYPGARDPHVVRATNLPRFPAPALQADPAAEMRAFRAEQLRQLNGVWWVDRPAGTVHQPIDDAMRRLAATGIPDWPVTASPAR